MGSIAIDINVVTLRDLHTQIGAITNREGCEFLDYPLILEKERDQLVDLNIVMYKEDGCKLVVFKEVK